MSAGSKPVPYSIACDAPCDLGIVICLLVLLSSLELSWGLENEEKSRLLENAPPIADVFLLYLELCPAWLHNNLNRVLTAPLSAILETDRYE